MRKLPRYLGASMAALGVDMGGFMLLLRLGLAPVGASALGYALGVVAHWCLSAHAVFPENVESAGVGRLRQQALFAASALVGLGMTMGVVALGMAAGLDPRPAKLAAVAASFVATYALRARIVFGGARAA